VRFLVDMCVDVRVAQWLRDQGHDSIHLRELGLIRLPNGEIFRRAASERRTVLTIDLDFGEIAASTSDAPARVIVLRLRNTRFLHVIDRLSAILPGAAAALERGAVVSVEEARHRVRALPIGRGHEG
jgi:predicted nuclease of predicted toxin-antitoxin system